MAIGSSARIGVVPRSTDAAADPSFCSTSDRTNVATAAGVGWSNTRVEGSLTPVALPSRLRNSTPPSESKPMTLKGFSTSTSLGEV